MATIKVIAFILGIIVGLGLSLEGYRAIEAIFFGAVAFAGTFFSLVMALSARDKRRANDYRRRNQDYIYDENNPKEYQS